MEGRPSHTLLLAKREQVGSGPYFFHQQVACHGFAHPVTDAFLHDAVEETSILGSAQDNNRNGCVVGAEMNDDVSPDAVGHFKIAQDDTDVMGLLVGGHHLNCTRAVRRYEDVVSFSHEHEPEAVAYTGVVIDD